ncbi:hypothetical protein OIY81_1856 [Cryptosporidium canis]|uniref:Uncharacterized protein n=1 Tax=Cryptosporidium canis TaxID=195482 RepID=A0ABQ8P8P9_9CRYT|nr:hypothetical protein OIY81_1856 [Cryptosporidium canis]KAJ1612135.1 hypothetical protein OJ252_1347 [Cryptosporidium canis]
MSPDLSEQPNAQDFDTSQFDTWELDEISISPKPNEPPFEDSNKHKHDSKCSSCELYLRRINGLENELQILTNNIYSLFKTAKEEIQRKDKLIQEKDELIKQLRKTKTTKQSNK